MGRPISEFPDEIKLYLQGRGPKAENWSTIGTGTAEEIEKQRRYWLEHNRRVIRDHLPVLTELRIVRVERYFGPVIHLPATKPADAGGGGRRIPPSE